MRQISVGKNEENQRLDKFLLKYLNQAPASFVYKMLRKKNITLNKKKASGKEKISLGDEICLFLSEETIISFQEKKEFPIYQKKLEVLYEDENISLINKPAGMLSQKAKDEDVSACEYYISQLLREKKISQKDLETFHPAVCNRLDRNTSGILCCGKTLAGSKYLSSILKNRSLHKYYLAIVSGKLSGKRRMRAFLKKEEIPNKVKIYDREKEGSVAIETVYESLVVKEDFSLVKVELITGKTHQIRAHLASIGHPILGDGKYGNKKIVDKSGKERLIKRQMLHAYCVEFPKESDGGDIFVEEKKCFAPLPQDFKDTLYFLGCKEEVYEGK